MSLQYQDPANTATTTSPPSSSLYTTSSPPPLSSSKKKESCTITWIFITTTITLVFAIYSWVYIHGLVNFLVSCLSSPEVCLNLTPLINQVGTTVELLQSLPSTTGKLEGEIGEIKKILLYILCMENIPQPPEIALICLSST